MIEFTIDGLNAKQRVLADILWSLQGYEEVTAFIEALPRREQRECATIIELMKMAVVEQCYDGIGTMEAADKVLKKITKKA
jgi:hypothetical protein